MSQPFDRGCKVPAPGEPDEELGEFWVEDPWQVSLEENLSAFERNRAFLNIEGSNFLDISYLTGADSDGDGRNSVPVDIDNDGRQDLIVRQAGGRALMVFENRFPKQHWLKVSLRGQQSNRLGIGARLVASVGGREIVRELYPVNSYRSQAPSRIQFGLAEANKVDLLTIRWPSGQVQQLRNVAADRHILVEEGSDKIETIRPGQVY